MPLTEVIVTPSLEESWFVPPWRANIHAWEKSSDGTIMVTSTMVLVLPAETWMAMSLMFTSNRLARLARNCAWRAPVKSEGSHSMVNVAETTRKVDPPGGTGGGEGGGGEGGREGGGKGGGERAICI
jgi:hypothetical protein